MSNLITIQQKLEEMRQKGKTDLFYLATRILGFDKMTDLHRNFAQKFSEKRKKNIRLWLLPRGHFKTSLFTVAGSIFYLLKNPMERILISSAVLANSKDMVSEIGDVFIRNELFRNLFPEWCPENPKMPEQTWTKAQIELPNRKDFAKMEKSVEAHGADTAVVSRHYTRLMFDDIVAPGNFETPELRKKVLNYFRACLSLKESVDTPIDIVGTRWHDNDLYSELISNWDIEVIKIPAIQDGKPIFPEAFSLEALDELKKNQGSYIDR